MRVNIGHQSSRAGEEGLACLVASGALFGVDYNLHELRSAHIVSSNGLTPRQLVAAAASMKLGARIIQFDPDALGDLASPTVLECTDGGYILFDHMLRGRGARIFDPVEGWRRADAAEIRRRTTRVGIELVRSEPIEAPRTRSPIRAASLFRWHAGMRTSVIQALIISLFLQFYTAISPMYFRLVIDEVVVGGGFDLLVAAALGFALLALFNTGATILRGIVFQNLNNQLSWDMSQRVFRHLMRLPLDWFQSRRLADVLSRLQGVDAVRGALTGVLGAAFDALMAALTIFILLFVSPVLAGIGLAGFVLLIVIRLAAVPFAIRLSNKSVVANVAEYGKRMEMLRAIQSIKAMGAEADRENDWLGRFAEALGASRRSAIFEAIFGSSQGLVSTLISIVAIYVGAMAVLDGQMTLGMLTAALAYLGQFTQSASNVFQQVITWRMLDVQLERVSDIVLEPVEKDIDKAPGHAGEAIRGSVAAEGLCFSYGPGEPLLFKDLALTVDDGEHVAIVGPSGSGKSTLLKLLTGLYRPSAGVIRIDGRPLDFWGPRAIRQILGVVMQEDELLAGSIAENVAFFAEPIDFDRVWECIAAAALEAEVQSFPVGIETLVGDMGSALSGGQKQRVLIARALYRRPRLLVLDEATSHLDVESERVVIRNLDKLQVTRIVVAHRQETIMAAQRILRLEGGGLIEERRT